MTSQPAVLYHNKLSARKMNLMELVFKVKLLDWGNNIEFGLYNI